MAVNEEAREYLDEYSTWIDTYKTTEFLDNTPENWEKVQQMDPHLVWTDHGTCEDPQVTSGAHMYSGRCCWETYGWYIGTVPWEESPAGPDQTYISFKTSVYLSCPTCNPDGENEDCPEDCVGDTEVPNEGCEDGWIQYYFD